MAATTRRPAGRLAVAIYPRAMRERYGAEIADLLAHSSRPVRDLIDVVWCALVEQGDHMAGPQLRTRRPEVIRLLAVPLLLGMALLAVASFAILLVGAFDNGADQTLAALITAAAVVPVGAVAIWLGQRIGRRESVPAPYLVVPALLALGTLAVACLPIVGEALGETRPAVAVAILLWFLTSVGLAAIAHSQVVRHRRLWVGVLVMVVGAALALDLTFIAYAQALPAAFAPGTAAYWWYPITVSGIGADGPGGVIDLSETLKGLPAMLTVCTAFTLAHTAARPARTGGGGPAAG